MRWQINLAKMVQASFYLFCIVSMMLKVDSGEWR
jgi:hypothetical protein